MRTHYLIAVTLALSCAATGLSQEVEPQGFVITLKNGSMVKGQTLARDESSGNLRLTMTQTAAGRPRSFAIIAMDDADSIRASTADTDSIVIRLVGGSELRCREFTLDGDTVVVKLGQASRIEVRWEQIESISFES